MTWIDDVFANFLASEPCTIARVRALPQIGTSWIMLQGMSQIKAVYLGLANVAGIHIPSSARAGGKIW